jgi:hypothetical protein
LTTSKTFTALFSLQYDTPIFVGMGRRLDHIEDVYCIVLFTIWHSYLCGYGPPPWPHRRRLPHCSFYNMTFLSVWVLATALTTSMSISMLRWDVYHVSLIFVSCSYRLTVLSISCFATTTKVCQQCTQGPPLLIDESLTIYPSSYASFVAKEAMYARVLFAKLSHHA